MVVHPQLLSEELVEDPKDLAKNLLFDIFAEKLFDESKLEKVTLCMESIALSH